MKFTGDIYLQNSRTTLFVPNIILLLLIFIACCWGKAYAVTCEVHGDPDAHATLPATMTIPADAGKSSVKLFETQVSLSSDSWISCPQSSTGQSLYTGYWGYTEAPSSVNPAYYPNYYGTNIPGVYVESWVVPRSGSFEMEYPSKVQTYSIQYKNIGATWHIIIWYIPSTVKGGNSVGNYPLVLPSYLASWGYVSPTSSSPYKFRLLLDNEPDVIVPGACEVKNNAIEVPMGDHNANDFKGTGTTSEVKAFSIPLHCTANTKISVMIEGQAASGLATSGVLNLDKDAGSATGVGVQVLKSDNTPLGLNRDIDVGEVVDEQDYDINLGARYYQTGSKVTPGAANATASFTLTYK